MSNNLLNRQTAFLQNRERIFSEIKKYPNVIHVGVGLKEVRDEFTPVLCYRVYVSEKKDPGLLREEEKIPATIDGFATDVIPYGIVEEIVMDDKPYRPLKGGIQIKNDLYVDVKTRGGGTLGCFALLNDGSDQIVGLTNQHVVAWNTEDTNPEFGNKVGQPWKRICCCCCEKDLIGSVLDSKKNDQVDCAIIELHEDMLNEVKSAGTLNEIQEIGTIKGKAMPELGLMVKKRGAATQLTQGHIVDIAFDHGQILIAPDDPTIPFAAFGDSGSVVLNLENRVVGLLWALKRDRFTSHSPATIPHEDPRSLHNQTTALRPRVFGVATPIDAIETALQIKIPSPPAVVPSFSIHPDDTKTHLIPSTLPAASNPKLHFVTAKGAGDILLRVAFDVTVEPHRVAWTSDNPAVIIVSPGVGTDRLTARINRNVPTGAKALIGVTVDGYSVGEKVAVWIVWSAVAVNESTTAGIQVNITQDFISVTDDLKVRFLIQPAEIIPFNAGVEDVPDLRGANATAPPDVPAADTGVFNKGVNLSGGARVKWDPSVRIRCKVINTNGVALPASDPFNQTFPNYPSAPLAGNFDTTSLSIEGDPYSDDDLGEFRRIVSDAVVAHLVRHNTGITNDKLEFRIHVEHFARLELAGQWYNISDPHKWKLHMKIRKASEFAENTDFDNDGDKLDEVWVNDNSFDGFNNDDF